MSRQEWLDWFDTMTEIALREFCRVKPKSNDHPVAVRYRHMVRAALDYRHGTTTGEWDIRWAFEISEG